MAIRYFSRLRPLSIGCYPKPEDNKIMGIVNFEYRTHIEYADVDAWGFIEYEHELNDDDIYHYDLVKAPDIREVYCEKDDMTFVISEGEMYNSDNARFTKVLTFYFGSPDREVTESMLLSENPLKAIY